MTSQPTTQPPADRYTRPFGWPTTLWIGGLHLAALAAPFFFTWSGLVLFGVLYVLTGLGITLGYHRLLTHRSFHTIKPVEYLFTLFGVLANQEGPLGWASNHRKHHTHSDEDGDPHSPEHGFWWAHFGWLTRPERIDEERKLFNVKDLAKDPVLRFFERFHWVFPIVLGVVLYFLGELWSGSGVSWVLWGVAFRTVFVYHATWLVNSAAHKWGYRGFETTDKSRNLWWVAMLTFGEGWHNNHHAHQRSAAHGLRWWEVDVTYMIIRGMAWIGLARDIHVSPKPKAKPGSRKSVWRILWPKKGRRMRKVTNAMQ
ncbi:MAG: fatty acid desaturase [Fimbriiglobus sp.]|nr:fatty acid desaturase [Fimbriiglobus sp.]